MIFKEIILINNFFENHLWCFRFLYHFCFYRLFLVDFKVKFLEIGFGCFIYWVIFIIFNVVFFFIRFVSKDHLCISFISLYFFCCLGFKGRIKQILTLFLIIIWFFVFFILQKLSVFIDLILILLFFLHFSFLLFIVLNDMLFQVLFFV